MNMIFYRNDVGYDVRTYEKWLMKNSARLPLNAKYYACASWHYDFKNHLCPHDAWLEEIKLREVGEGSRREKRSNDGLITFLGAFQDLKFELRYDLLKAVEILRPVKSGDIGFGDWLIDEVTLDDAGLVVHEILFSTSASIKITCVDLQHSYTML